MSEKDFNSSFANALVREFGPGAPPEQIAFEIFRRDQRRARVYALLSLFFWLIGTAGMFVLVLGLNRLVLAMRITGIRRPSTEPYTHDEQAVMDQVVMWGTSFIHHSLPYIGGSVIALLLAALFTVLYVSSSRQSTLTRINISLMQICEEMRAMRRPGNA